MKIGELAPLTRDEILRGWVEFHCPKHGGLAAASPTVSVKCHCGKWGKRVRYGKVLDPHDLALLIDPEKQRKKNRAHGRVREAVKSGQLERPSICSSCGKNGKIEGHHEDYDKPLDVEWLCASCHQFRHQKKSLQMKGS